MVTDTSIECGNDCFEDQNSEKLKIQKFGHGRSLRQSDHGLRSCMTQKTLIILYKLPLWLCFT